MSVVDGLADLVVPIDSLAPLPGNPRQGDVEAVAASLARFGQRKPIVVRSSDRTITAGNHTWLAAKSLGWSEIAAVVLDDDDATAGAYALADNRTAELGGYDERALLDLIRQVGDADPALLADTGWDEASVSSLVDQLEPSLPDVLPSDDAPAPPKDPKSALGDVYVLGAHRVMCGDSTDADSWDAVLDGSRATLVFTDPPYGISYKAMRGGRSIENDASASEALEVTRAALSLLSDAEAHFVCCDWRSLQTIVDAMEQAGIEPKACIVWDKQRRIQNLDRFAKQHEFIVYSGPYGGQPTVGTDVWSVARDFEPDHPTPKPVELVVMAIDGASAKGAVVADAFGGSGATLMACEATGRRARLIELDPRYVDVICRRWQDFTGGKPVLESTGEVVDFTDASA